MSTSTKSDFPLKNVPGSAVYNLTAWPKGERNEEHDVSASGKVSISLSFSSLELMGSGVRDAPFAERVVPS